MSGAAAEKKEKNSFFKNLKIEFKKIVWPDRDSVDEKEQIWQMEQTGM